MVLDPLTALSVAGTIVQFVDFSCNLLSRTFTNIQDHGFDVDGELENTTESLFKLLTKLRRPLHDNTTIGCRTEDEEKLEKVCKECQNVADDLLERLKNLKSGGKNQVWRSFRQALKTVWSETEVQKLVRRLAMLKETVEIYILSGLSDKIDHISLEMPSRYEALDERTQNIITALLDTRSTISRQLHDQTIAISKLLSRAELVIADHDDTSRTTVIDAWRRKVASANTKQDEQHIEEKQSIDIFQVQEMKIRSKVEKYLLRSLNFPTMTTRE